eukprot:Skav219319  [mRNA]  locus=scaffold1957:61864:62313:- [translate_table: standard]
MADDEGNKEDLKKRKTPVTGKFDIQVPPYLITADILCDSTFNGAVPPQRMFLMTFDLPCLQRILNNVENQLVAYVRSQGGGAQSVALAQDFSRAMVGRMVWGVYLQAIRTARKTSHTWIAGQALPRPLPTKVSTLKYVQHIRPLAGVGP